MPWQRTLLFGNLREICPASVSSRIGISSAAGGAVRRRRTWTRHRGKETGIKQPGNHWGVDYSGDEQAKQRATDGWPRAFEDSDVHML